MTSEQTATKKTYFIMLLVPLFWGASFPLAKHVLTEIPPLTAAAFRFSSASVLLVILTVIKETIHWAQIKAQFCRLLLMAIIGIFGYNALFFLALTKTSAINGSLIIATTPVLLAAGAIVLLDEPKNKQLLIGIPLSLIGVLFVITEGSITTLLALNFNYGDLIFIGALICWTLHGLIGKAIMRDVSPLVTTTFTSLVGSVLLLITALFVEKGSFSQLWQMSAQSWSEMAFLIIFSSVAAFFLWNDGIKKIGASKSGIYLNLNPVWTSIISLILYGSYITGSQIFGMILVLVSVYFVTVHEDLMIDVKLKRTRSK